MAETLSESKQQARKAHGCSVCLGRISPGDEYVRQAVVDGGDFWTWKAHGLCDAAFHKAWDWRSHDIDNNPNWDEEIAPLVWAFFDALAAVLGTGNEEDSRG